jgi:hypothetical protein
MDFDVRDPFEIMYSALVKVSRIKWGSASVINTLRMGSFKLFKCPFPRFLTI